MGALLPDHMHRTCDPWNCTRVDATFLITPAAEACFAALDIVKVMGGTCTVLPCPLAQFGRLSELWARRYVTPVHLWLRSG